jgi:hypothetical protein
MSAAGVRDQTASSERADRWIDEFLSSPRGQSLSHVVAIERPGPSHTLESLAAQPRQGPPPVARFEALVPVEHRGVCHNMRGEPIDLHVARTHRLFETIARRRLPITTIGLGDGGNEIGMGRFAWELLVEAVPTEAAARIICQTATDFTLLAGVSNWAAYALALAVARLRGAVDAGRGWTAVRQRELIEQMVRQTPAVDGLTRHRAPTVDGLPLDVYLRPLDEMHKLLRY